MGTWLPPLERRLFRLLMHEAEVEEVLDALADEYAARGGGVRARWWLWRQLAGSAPAVFARGWHRGFTGFESEANEMKRGGAGLESWIMDARFALRGLGRRPQYVVLAVLTLALGIGGTAAVFGIARKVLIDPLPYRASSELVAFWHSFSWSEEEVVALRPEWPGFAGVAAYTTEGMFLRVPGTPSKVEPGIASSSELFDVLGARPLLGSTFRPGDDAVGAEPVAVLSYGLWQELGGDAALIGRTMELDGAQRRIIGVMPRGFWFPDPSVRVWAATPMRPDNGAGRYSLIGRLSPGRTASGMTEPLRRITARLSEQFTYPPQWDPTTNPQLTPLRESILGPVKPALLATLAGMGVILLMACANVATLMLGQLRGRTSELAVRSALGAGRRRLTQQLLVEAGMLAAVAGVMGGLLAAAGFQVLVKALPLGELSAAVRPEWSLFLSAMVLAFAAALLIAMAPVLSLWRGDLRDALNAARSGGIKAGSGRLEDILVIAEVAMAVLLAASAAVLIQSVANLRSVDSGVSGEGVAVIDITPPSDPEPTVRQQAVLDAIETLRSVPGVRSVGAVHRLPLRDRGDNWGLQVAENPEITAVTTALRVVSRDYFDVMGIRLLSGRTFDETDRAGGDLVIVIDRALAEKFFPGVDPIGRSIASGIGQGWMRIIGVVESVRHDGLTEDFGPGRYVLYDQYGYAPESSTLVFRVQDGTSPAAALQQGVRMLQQRNSALAVQDATTMNNILALAMGPTRRIMQLMTLLGVLALTLGAIGVYGVVSHFVNRRRRDWIIRMALGMKPAAALRQVLGRGTALVAIGCVFGIIAALLLTRMLSALLFEVSAADPRALAFAAVILIATGALAALIPAGRASRANPAQALRES